MQYLSNVYSSKKIFFIFIFAVFFLTDFTLAYSAEPQVKDMNITRKTDQVDIEIFYPQIGHEGIDNDLAEWAVNMADAFQDGQEREQDAPKDQRFELKASYDIERPSANAVTIVFKVSSYIGGAHGNLDIITLSYDVLNDKPLAFTDMFEDMEGALNIMSSYSYNNLGKSLGAQRFEEMLKSGTSPDADNFSSIALKPSSVCIYFQPYQVAPWSAGPQQVEIPLDELQEAKPLLYLWGRK